MCRLKGSPHLQSAEKRQHLKAGLVRFSTAVLEELSFSLLTPPTKGGMWNSLLNFHPKSC